VTGSRHRPHSSGGKERVCLVVGAGDNVAENAKLSEHFASVIGTDEAVNRAVDVVCDGHELRDFEEMERGICGGAATSLLWSLDVFLERASGNRNGANGFYFEGRNRKQPCLDARQLIVSYTGHRR
jgi:hypothetical protein